ATPPAAPHAGTPLAQPRPRTSAGVGAGALESKTLWAGSGQRSLLRSRTGSPLAARCPDSPVGLRGDSRGIRCRSAAWRSCLPPSHHTSLRPLLLAPPPIEPLTLRGIRRFVNRLLRPASSLTLLQ